jgi:cell shape-determining protein MreD
VTSPDDIPEVEPQLGEVERVPLKVVPIYVQPIEDEPEPVEEQEEVIQEETAPKPRTVVFAAAAAVLALGTLVAHIVAIAVATAGDFPAGTLLGYVAIGLSVLAVVVGAVAIIRRRARRWAIAAVVLAVLANPIVLLTVLSFLSGLQTG